jgi:hypothetical protein
MAFPEKESFTDRLNCIEWTAYRTAYGPAFDVPKQLSGLASADHAQAMTASHDLWCGLVHQKVQLATAAVPALPFILEVLDQADEALTTEIMDILDGMAIGTTSDFWKMGNVPTWALQLRQALQAELPRFLKMKDSANRDIRYFALNIVDVLS